MGPGCRCRDTAKRHIKTSAAAGRRRNRKKSAGSRTPCRVRKLMSFSLINLRPFPPARPALRVAQRFFDALGFQLIDYRPACTDIKDAELYKPMFAPWLLPEWSVRLHADDPRSLLPIQARYNLFCLASDATRRCSG